MCRRGRNRVREQRSHQLSGHGDRQHARLAWVYGKHVAECASVQQDRIVQKKKVAHGGERACEGHRLDAFLSRAEPKFEGSIRYGPRQGHCWSGSTEMELMRRMAERIGARVD